MGNNNATAILTEEDSSKLETNGISSFESGSVENKQEQMFLAEEGKDEDAEKENLPDGEIDKGTPEIEPQDQKVEKVEEEMNQSSLESTVMENDEKLQKQTSVKEGLQTLCEVIEVEELTMIETQSIVSDLNTTPFSNEAKTSVIDESLEEIVHPREEVLKVEKETSLEQRSEFPEIESQEILNLNYCVDDEVKNEGKGALVISEPDLQESKAIQENGFEVSKEEKVKELGREASLKRMSRCRSLPVSQNSRVLGESLVQNLVAYPSRNKMGLKKPKTSKTKVVSCVGSKKDQETKEVITESKKEARLEMRSPTFVNDLIIEERSDQLTDKTRLLCQDKTETNETRINTEEKPVMLKRTESEETRGIELSLGLSMKHRENSEAGDNLHDKKANMSEFPLVSCIGSNITQETTEDALLEMRSPSFGNDLRIEERSDESKEKALMLKRTESEETRSIELSLGLSIKHRERSEAEDKLVSKKGNTSELPLVSCIGSNITQDTTEAITENNKEAVLEMRSPTFGNDIRSDESMEKTPLLCQDKTETRIDVEKKTVMLKRSKSEKTKGIEVSLGLSLKHGERSDSLRESKSSGDNLWDKKASLGSIKVRKRSKSSILGTCLCCTIE